jgi:hypothetical protein
LPGGDDRECREALTEADLGLADETVRLAWNELPAAHRELLEEIDASQWQVVDEPLGGVVDGLLRSADHPGLSRASLLSTDKALGVWVSQLRLMLLDAGHESLEGLVERAYDELVSSTAWHEWGHALSIERCTREDVADGPRLLELAPEGVGESIRKAGYRRSEYTHELVANVYALLMVRRRQDLLERPQWLNEEIHELVVRATGWTEFTG